MAELRDRALVYLLAYSGARSSEVLRDPNDARRDGLQWADIDFEAGVLTVLGKSQAEERGQLPAQARPALARLETALAPPSDDWPVIPTLHAPTLHGCLADDIEVDEDRTEPSEQFLRVVVSWSPLASGGEHVELFEKGELEMLDQWECLGRRDIEELLDTILFLQGLSTAGHNSFTLFPYV